MSVVTLHSGDRVIVNTYEDCRDVIRDHLSEDLADLIYEWILTIQDDAEQKIDILQDDRDSQEASAEGYMLALTDVKEQSLDLRDYLNATKRLDKRRLDNELQAIIRRIDEEI